MKGILAAVAVVIVLVVGFIGFRIWQAQQMAAKYIQDGNAAIVVVGDLKVVKDQVASYGTIAD